MDKLIRPASDSLEGVLLSVAKRAALAEDIPAWKKVLHQVNALREIAADSGDKALKARSRALWGELERMAHNPAGTFVLETKALAKRAAVSADPEFDAAAVAGRALGEIRGYGSTFGNVDLGGDRILPGAFADTLAEWKRDGRQPVMLASHDMGSFPIGVWTSVAEDSFGLRVTGSVADTTRGREAWSLMHMQPSALDGLSIGYSTVKSRISGGDVRELQAINLYEISIVSLPMNTRARLDLGKSRSSARTANAYERVQAGLTGLRDILSDERGSNVVKFPNRQTDDEDGEVLEALQQLSRTLRR